MKVQVKKWGNSQGVRLPKKVLEKASISEEDLLDVRIKNGVISLIKPGKHKTLEERAAEYGGELKLDGEYNWAEPIVYDIGDRREGEVREMAAVYGMSMTDVINNALDDYIIAMKKDPFYRLTANVEDVSGEEAAEIMAEIESVTDDDLQITRVEHLKV